MTQNFKLPSRDLELSATYNDEACTEVKRLFY